jgi:DNA mismatch endonuclease Vsr
MTDHIDRAQRSRNMAAVRSKDTKPEMVVRKLVHSLGYRYRLHVANLPGRPDLAFPAKRKVIFVHGCFWHRHPECNRASIPKIRQAFWKAKFEKNVARDACNIAALDANGWGILTLWECEIKNDQWLRKALQRFLS